MAKTINFAWYVVPDFMPRIVQAADDTLIDAKEVSASEQINGETALSEPQDNAA